MCGICAGIANENQIFNVVLGLKKLDYRGYDSSGIAFCDGAQIKTIKAVGTVKNLEKKIDEKASAQVVIGHTRWATHGGISEVNAHPHLSQDGQFAIVHNGIIENFEQLKQKYNFNLISETDSEVFVNLIAQQSGDVLDKMISASKLARGSFAVALLHAGEEKIYIAKQGSPLLVALGKGGGMVASDSSVFGDKYDKIFCMEDAEFAILEKEKVTFFDKNKKKIEKTPILKEFFDFDEETLEEKFFMLKEIKEQPTVLRKTYFKYFSQGVNVDFESIKKFKSFHFVACGTAYHSCLMGARYIQQLCKKECNVSIASEFRYADNLLNKNCLYIFVSQSGETADTIACAKLVKEGGFSVLCVTNVPYCSLNNFADYVLPTFAGREVAVASTKAYTAQVLTLLTLAAKISGKAMQEKIKRFVLNFEDVFFDESVLKEIFKYKKIFFIGRGQDYVTCLEGGLKLKEIAYINCLGIPAGELKHGTLALIDEDTLIIAVATQENLKEKMYSNILEAKSRGAKVLVLSQFEFSKDVFQITLPKFEEIFMPIVSIVPLQHMAFEYAQKLGYSPDKPRNLAKSVTVE